MKQLTKLQNNEIDVDIEHKIDEFNNVDEIVLLMNFKNIYQASEI